MADFHKILQLVLALAGFVIWIYMMSDFVMQSPMMTVYILVLCLVMGWWYAPQIQETNTVLARGQEGSVKRARKDYLESDTMSEHEFEQRLDEAMGLDE